MNEQLLVLLTLIAGQAMAMEMTNDDERAIPTNTTDQKVIIPIQEQEREIPARFIPLIGVLADIYKDGTLLQMSPITLVNLEVWQLIEDQLERVYEITHGNHRLRDEIIADYSQLDTTSLIDLIKALDFLTVPLLKEIALEVAQNKLTIDKILWLPKYVRNEVIKRKAFNIVGPIPGREHAVCKGHEDIIHSLCGTHDGKIISGSHDKTVRIWDTNDQQLAVCNGHKGEVWSVCITSDGKIVSGSHDKTVRVWDLNGQELAICRGHEGEVCSVCITADGKIVSGSWDKTVRIWDINGQQLAVCRGHEDEVSSVCVTPDDKIVSGSFDKTVRVWDMNGKQLAVCEGHEGSVNSVYVTPDGKIISGSDDNTMRIWDINGQQLAVCRSHEGWVISVCATDNKIISGSWVGTVRVWAMNGQKLAVCRGHNSEVSSVCVTTDGKIVSGSHDKTVVVWNMKGQKLAVCRGHEEVVFSVCVPSDSKIVSGSYDKTLRIWDISLLDRLSAMNQEQAHAIYKLLQSATCENQEQKEQRWKEIAKILEEQELVSETKNGKES